MLWNTVVRVIRRVQVGQEWANCSHIAVGEGSLFGYVTGTIKNVQI